MKPKSLWLKIKEDFFDDPNIRELRAMERGDTLLIIMQKLMLLSLNASGAIELRKKKASKFLADILEEREEDIITLLQFMFEKGMIESIGEHIYYMPLVSKLKGEESASAGRVRELRMRAKIATGDFQVFKCESVLEGDDIFSNASCNAECNAPCNAVSNTTENASNADDNGLSGLFAMSSNAGCNAVSNAECNAISESNLKTNEAPLMNNNEEYILDKNLDKSLKENLESIKCVGDREVNRERESVRGREEEEEKEPLEKRFVRPTLVEVTRYVREKNYPIDPEAFVAYYDSKGWLVGKSPMKDWRAAMRTWVINAKRREEEIEAREKRLYSTPQAPRSTLASRNKATLEKLEKKQALISRGLVGYEILGEEGDHILERFIREGYFEKPSHHATIIDTEVWQ